MARVTVEDCVDKIPNRFDLVLLSAQRARQISGGAELTIDRDRDKNPVVALREVAEETVRPKELQEALISGLQTVPIDDADVADAVGNLAHRPRRCGSPPPPRRATRTTTLITRGSPLAVIARRGAPRRSSAGLPRASALAMTMGR